MAAQRPREFYVYLHKTPAGRVFYVGKGFGGRAWLTRRSRAWSNAVKKYGGFVVEMAYVGLQEWAAHEIEQGLIAMYGRRDLGLGQLVNMTDGGEGGAGIVFTQERRKAIGDRYRGKTLPPEAIKKMSESKRGKKCSAAHKAKLSEVRSGENAPWFGKKRSEETKRKISEKNAGRIHSEEEKKKRAASMRIALDKPEVRARLSEATKAAWKRRKSAQFAENL